MVEAKSSINDSQSALNTHMHTHTHLHTALTDEDYKNANLATRESDVSRNGLNTTKFVSRYTVTSERKKEKEKDNAR